MSKLNYNRKTFLSREELGREQLFRDDMAFSKILLTAITKGWGIVSSQKGSSSTELRVTADTNPGTVRISPGYIVSKDKNLVTVPEIRYLSVPETGAPYYVILSHAYVNYEDGYVSVDVSGNLNGLNTDFFSVLRGQGTQAPVNVRFVKEDGSEALNNGIYEVVEVLTGNSAVINSYASLVAEQNLRMIVLGTLPIGGVFSEEQLVGLYSYDRYDSSKLLTPSENGGVPAYVEDIDFPIAKVVNNGGVITVSEEETLRKYWTI